ncbi:MAG: serine/threonine-protein kinase RsbW [bacterium]|jgi:serine/threonine-protein kinase RsbW
MKLMILKHEFDSLVEYMEKEAKGLGILEQDIDQIEIETMANLRFTFPGTTNQLELIRRITRRLASILDFSEQVLDDIGLAIDEACTNVINHSYRGDHSGNIKVDFELNPVKFIIMIVDEGYSGQTFNPDLLSPIDKEAYLQKLTRGGLGVHLIKKIMDEVEYTVSPGVSNCLKMVKYTYR